MGNDFLPGPRRGPQQPPGGRAPRAGRGLRRRRGPNAAGREGPCRRRLRTLPRCQQAHSRGLRTAAAQGASRVGAPPGGGGGHAAAGAQVGRHAAAADAPGGRGEGGGGRRRRKVLRANRDAHVQGGSGPLHDLAEQKPGLCVCCRELEIGAGNYNFIFFSS